MSVLTIRERLHQTIDHLPDDVIEQIADFTFFMMAKQTGSPQYTEWSNPEWQEFALHQFFDEEDEVTYSLDDAQEVYHP